MKETGNAELILDAAAELGEGAFWDAGEKLLYWVDILKNEVHIFNPAGNSDRAIDVGQPPGTVVTRKKGGLAVALYQGIYFLDELSGKLSFAAGNPENHLPDNRFNDGKCDPMGRFWVGTYNTKDIRGTGALYRIDADLSIKKMLKDISCSNGITWSPDNSRMYYIDTPAMQVWAFDYDIATGEIKNQRVAVEVPGSIGMPDGMAIDAEGMIWVALWGGYGVIRCNPSTGEILEKVNLPVAQITSCSFGGEDLKTLYITSARTGLDETALKGQPLAGGLFKVGTGIEGMAFSAFAG